MDEPAAAVNQQRRAEQRPMVGDADLIASVVSDQITAARVSFPCVV